MPDDLLAIFGGPGHGVAGARRRAQAEGRALTASALKPQGLPAPELARLAYELALGGLDFVKDDHGLANQSYSPFADRVRACAAAVRKASAASGKETRYAPSLSGSFAEISRQIGMARDEGLDTVLIAPVIAGLSNFQALRRANPDFAFLAHPTMSGAAISLPFTQSVSAHWRRCVDLSQSRRPLRLFRSDMQAYLAGSSLRLGRACAEPAYARRRHDLGAGA